MYDRFEILTFDSHSYGEGDLCLNNLGYLVYFNHQTFHLNEDNLFENDGIVFNDIVKIGTFRINSSSDNGKIAWLVVQQAFKSVDYNDGTFLSAQSMPSSKYIDLTLGASGSTYTAPANGWFSCGITGTAGSTYMEMNIYDTEVGVCASFNGGWGRAVLPVCKGRRIIVFYKGNDFACNQFRFSYAEGEI